MTILIRQARVICEHSEHHGKTVDLLIESGQIKVIRKVIPAPPGSKVIEAEGLCVSSGWFDLQSVSGEPGFEHRETLDSLIKSAASGGFTGLLLHSNTHPAIDNKAQVEYIQGKTRNKAVDVYAAGTITAGGTGHDLSEMYDMKQAGAVAFSDYKHPLQDAGMVLRALQYSKGIGSFIITHCQDLSLTRGGQMNEGESSTLLGLKGMPALAEEVMIERNLSILEYCGGKLHVPCISSKGSVQLIRKAKASGLNVTCGVAAVNLFLDDSVLKEFNSNYKINPPLRTKKDVLALRNAVENGTIDVIMSDHNPLDSESKELEFDLSDFGMIGLQTAYSCALEGLKEKNINAIVRCFTEGPRKILGLEQISITEQTQANLTLFTTKGQSVLTERNNNSKSSNSPFLNEALNGAVLGVINGAKSHFN
jgi:dihydroorotase